MPSCVIAIRQVDDDQRAVYMSGQSAVDGSFLVDRDFDSVVEEINECMASETQD